MATLRLDAASQARRAIALITCNVDPIAHRRVYRPVHLGFIPVNPTAGSSRRPAVRSRRPKRLLGVAAHRASRRRCGPSGLDEPRSSQGASREPRTIFPAIIVATNGGLKGPAVRQIRALHFIELSRNGLLCPSVVSPNGGHRMRLAAPSAIGLVGVGLCVVLALLKW